MYPLPAEYSGIVAIVVAVIVSAVAALNFLRGLRSAPAPTSSVLTGVGMALSQDNPAIREIATAIREGQISRGELIHEIQGLSRSLDNLADEVRDAGRSMRHRDGG